MNVKVISFKIKFLANVEVGFCFVFKLTSSNFKKKLKGYKYTVFS